MTARGVTIGVAMALVVAACGSGGSDAAPTTTAADATTTTAAPTTTAPERQASTTTTEFDPASAEGAVEAAYLRSWDVYADAVYNLELDEPALAEVFAGDALTLRTNEVKRRMSDRRASLVLIDHDYEVVRIDDSTFSVIDHFVNHQVLIDPDSKSAIEPDPNERLLVNFKLQLIDEGWKVVFIQKVSP